MNSASVVTCTKPAEDQHLNVPALRRGGLWRPHPWAKELLAANDCVGRESQFPLGLVAIDGFHAQGTTSHPCPHEQH